MDMVHGEEGYDNHHQYLEVLENDAPLIEIDDHVQWWEIIKVPKRDRALLEASVPKLIGFIANIEDFYGMADEIRVEAEALERERKHLLLALHDSLLYSSFPGDCKYLR